MSDKPSNVLIISKIPKLINGERKEKIEPSDTYIYKFDTSEIPISDTSKYLPFRFLSENLTQYTTELIDVQEKKVVNKILCNGGLCCSFDFGFEPSDKNIEDSIKKQYR